MCYDFNGESYQFTILLHQGSMIISCLQRKLLTHRGVPLKFWDRPRGETDKRPARHLTQQIRSLCLLKLISNISETFVFFLSKSAFGCWIVDRILSFPEIKKTDFYFWKVVQAISSESCIAIGTLMPTSLFVCLPYPIKISRLLWLLIILLHKA